MHQNHTNRLAVPRHCDVEVPGMPPHGMRRPRFAGRGRRILRLLWWSHAFISAANR
jgi:hypothetical protein